MTLFYPKKKTVWMQKKRIHGMCIMLSSGMTCSWPYTHTHAYSTHTSKHARTHHLKVQSRECWVVPNSIITAESIELIYVHADITQSMQKTMQMYSSKYDLSVSVYPNQKKIKNRCKLLAKIQKSSFSIHINTMQKREESQRNKKISYLHIHASLPCWSKAEGKVIDNSKPSD